MSSSTTSPSPLRIACLHGFRQNARLFRRKTGGLRKSLERDISLVQGASSKLHKGPRVPMAQLHYLDAPFILERIEKDLAIDHTAEHQGRAYFRAVYSPRQAHSAGEGSTESQENDATERTWLMAEGTEYVGWDQTFQFLRNEFAERRYDGILAFSQGAIVTSIICALRNEPENRSAFSSLRFVICISGFPSRAEEHKHLFSRTIDLPSMHIWGLRDEIIAHPRSRRLRDIFSEQEREVVEHNGGHVVPNDAQSRQKVCDFVLRYAQESGDIRVAAL